MSLTAPERRFIALLRIVAFVLLVGTGAFLVATLVSPAARVGIRQPPWLIGVIAPSVLFAMLCTYAAGDPRRRGILAGMYAAGELAVASLAAVYVLRGGVPNPGALYGQIAFDTIVPLLVLGFWIAARPAKPAPERVVVSDAGFVRFLLAVVAVVGAGLAAVSALGPVMPRLAPVAADPLLSARVAGSAAVIAVLALYIAVKPSTRMPLVSIIGVSLVAFGVAAAWSSRWAGTAEFHDPFGITLPVATVLWLRAGAALAMAALLWAAKDRAYQRSFSPAFLGGTGYRSLVALTDAVLPVDPHRVVPPRDVATSVDGYLTQIRAVRRFLYPWVLRAVQWHPVLYLKAPLSELDRELAFEHLRAHFEEEPERGVVPRIYDRILRILLFPFRGVAQSLVNIPQLGAEELIRVSKQLVYVGYYSDARTFQEIGYAPFEERPRAVTLKERGLVPSPGVHKLKVHLPIDIVGDRPSVEADVCIIGTGAGGSVLAHHLAQQGKSVVMLEKGQYVEPRSMNANEVEMFGKLYADGVFQQTEDFRFTVLQGNAVGGTTVVNNAVSFKTPQRVLKRWNEAFAAGLDPAQYDAGADAVMEMMRMRPQVEHAPWGPNQRVNPSAPLYLEGIRKLGIPPEQLEVGPVTANVCNCIGCGYCNIGCRYGAKLSMLDTLLPASQRTARGEDAVRIIAEAKATRIRWTNGGPTKRATHVEAQLDDGRTLTVRAGKIVVSAGTIASSYLLQQSGVKGLPVGQGVCFNMGSPLTAEFDHELNAYDGLQISHFGVPDPSRGWVYETWFNPPVSQAINMPGWFGQHFANMRAYGRLMAVGVLVGTDRNATIGTAMTGGPAVHYAPTAADLKKLADGLAELGDILLAAGATRVMLNTWKYREYRQGENAKLRQDLQQVIARPGELTLGTGHPQGGNAISTNPALGVVGSDFRVHGFDNLYVCDASVIPSSLTVNPQLTVMSLAHYAAPGISK
jgi:choline dehydrogenase-like flavoprotein